MPRKTGPKIAGRFCEKGLHLSAPLQVPFKLPAPGAAASRFTPAPLVQRPRTPETGQGRALLRLLAGVVSVLFGFQSLASTPTDAQLTDAQLEEAFETAADAVRALAVPDQPTPVAGAHGGAVTLRYDGRVIGRGSHLGADGFDRALAEAIREARDTLKARYPIAEDRLAIAFGSAIAIDIELAGEPAPISIETYLDASKVVSPGAEGIAFRAGRLQAAAFPGELRSARTEPSEALPGVIERALGRPGLSARPLADVLAEAPDARVVRFATRQIAQPSSGKPPLMLHRGGRLAQPLETKSDLRRLETRVSSFLRRWPADRRAYDPINNQFETSNTREAAIARALLALTDPDEVPAEEILTQAIDTLDGSDQGRGLALYLRVLRGDDRTALRDQTAALAWELGIAGMAGEMPWLGFAAIELADDAPIAAPALREFLALAMSHQVRAADTSEQDRDLQGGIVFTSRENPLPDWRTAQVVAFAARATSEAALISPDDRADHLARVMESVRFLDQLSATAAEAHAYEVPPQAIGGVRSALWRSRMPVEASAITLRAIREAKRAAESVDANP